MARIKAKIVKSTIYPNEVSLRGEDSEANLRYILTKAGFTPGENIIIISESEFNRLIDSTVLLQEDKLRTITLDGHLFRITKNVVFNEYIMCAIKIDKMCSSLCAWCTIEEDSVYCQNHLIGKIVPKEQIMFIVRYNPKISRLL